MSRRNPYAAEVTTAAAAGLDPDGGPWVSICHKHGTVVNSATRAQARSCTTLDFCDGCRDDAADRATPAKVRVIHRAGYDPTRDGACVVHWQEAPNYAASKYAARMPTWQGPTRTSRLAAEADLSAQLQQLGRDASAIMVTHPARP